MSSSTFHNAIQAELLKVQRVQENRNVEAVTVMGAFAALSTISELIIKCGRELLTPTECEQLIMQLSAISDLLYSPETWKAISCLQEWSDEG